MEDPGPPLLVPALVAAAVAVVTTILTVPLREMIVARMGRSAKQEDRHRALLAPLVPIVTGRLQRIESWEKSLADPTRSPPFQWPVEEQLAKPIWECWESDIVGPHVTDTSVRDAYTAMACREWPKKWVALYDRDDERTDDRVELLEEFRRGLLNLKREMERFVRF